VARGGARGGDVADREGRRGGGAVRRVPLLPPAAKEREQTPDFRHIPPRILTRTGGRPRMRFARNLLFIGLMSFGPPAGALAASPFDLPDEATPPAQGYLPTDADPYYSTPGGFDRDVDMKLSTRRIVADPTGEAPG